MGTGSAPTGGVSVAPNDDKSAQLADEIQRIYSRADPSTDESVIARRELEATARLHLGEDYDRLKISVVAEIRRSWHEKQQQLTERLQRGDIGPEPYRAMLRELISEMATRCQTVLGDHDFERLFGVRAEDAPDLLAPSNT
jgi:hypothetical protein